MCSALAKVMQYIMHESPLTQKKKERERMGPDIWQSFA